MSRARSYDAYAITPPGVESITAGELRALGIEPGGSEPGGVSFTSDAAGVARANLELRTASRVLVRIASFHASAFHELERRAGKLAWDAYVPPGTAVSFRVTSRQSRLYHHGGIAERLLESVIGRVPRAVADSRGADAERDPADAVPVQLFVVRLLHDECTVSADASGAHLHQRGYRLASAKAPLRETLAAAMLLAAGWQGSTPLIDPLCGSGTIPIEAALLARRIAPGTSRVFAGEHWPEFPSTAWADARARAAGKVLARSHAPIVGSDRDAGAIEAAAENAGRAGVLDDIEFRRQAISALEPPPGSGLVATNPPYGVRVGRGGDLRDLYAQLGNVLRRRCPGWGLALLSARDELARQTRLPLEPALRTTNGGLRVKLLLASVPPAA
jgi:putative N6-adenine-specific DNA methylase